jgi:pimeloyl-ACP methyl ester carboxylesterase
MKKINSKNIVFVHGAFVGRNCWDEWVPYFESKGYKVTVPSWPHKEAPPAELRRRQPDPDIANLRMQDLIDHYTNVVNGLDEKPIAIGHSFGGLITQILLNRDLVDAGIAIHSVMPQGVFPHQFSFFKATWGPLGYLTPVHDSFLFTMDQWKYAFANGQSDEEAKRTYDLLVVPESKHISRDALTKTAHVDFKKPHNPLLFIAGSEDHIMPADLNHANFKKYEDNGSVKEFIEIAGNNHSVLGLPNWRQVADYSLEWIDKNRDKTNAQTAENNVMKVIA